MSGRLKRSAFRSLGKSVPFLLGWFDSPSSDDEFVAVEHEACLCVPAVRFDLFGYVASCHAERFGQRVTDATGTVMDTVDLGGDDDLALL